MLNDDIIKVNTPILLDKVFFQYFFNSLNYIKIKESGFKLMLYEGRADSLHILYCLLKRTSEGLNKLMTSVVFFIFLCILLLYGNFT